MRYLVIILFAFILSSSGCDTTVQKGSGSGRILPNITGGAGEVLVVIDKYMWEGNTGELLKDILQAEFPGLPQSEPLFDVTQITSSSFDNIFKFHRSVVLVTLNESAEEATVKFSRNVWAKPQIVVRIEAKNVQELDQVIQNYSKRIQNFLVQYDRLRLTDSYKASKDLEIQKLMAEHHHIRLGIPRGYNIDFFGDEFSSVSIETPDFSQVLQVYEYPSKGPEDLQTSKLIEKRNYFTKKYVKGPNENSYMTTAAMFPPVVYDLKIDSLNIVEIRGLWELEGGFMGGPFISHSVYDSKRHRIVTVEGYVYYPNQKKRIKLKQLEAIIYSLEII